MVEDRWIRFIGGTLQARLLEKVARAGLECRIDDQGRCWFDDQKWSAAGDPHIATLDEAFGPDWVSVPSRSREEHGQRLRCLVERQIPFVEWERDDGISLVILHDQCPPDWEFD